MRILLLGATGFIGRELFAALSARGHDVVPGVVDVTAAERLFPRSTPIRVDLNRDTDAAAWAPRLAGIDAVVNCAGILQATRSQSMRAIHYTGPCALFKACVDTGVRRVVQISAISAERGAGTEYALTKLAADEALRAMPLEWVVIRPSIVIARGAFGGTAFFRALAALPFAIPVPGRGEGAFQPIDIDDVCEVVVRAIERDDYAGKTLDPVGPEVVTLRALLEDYRRWLGFGKARVVSIPIALARFAARVGDAWGGPLNSTALRQLEFGNTGDYVKFAQEASVEARGWKQILARHPAHWQDRWHARLYFVRPLLRIALGITWVVSGLAGLAALGRWAPAVAYHLDIPIVAAGALLAIACVTDLALGALVLARWKPGRIALVQGALILGYTAAITVFFPALWIEPLGAVVKNLPILAGVLALAALEAES